MTDALYESVVNGSEYDLEEALKHNRSVYLAKLQQGKCWKSKNNLLKKRKKVVLSIMLWHFSQNEKSGA